MFCQSVLATGTQMYVQQQYSSNNTPREERQAQTHTPGSKTCGAFLFFFSFVLGCDLGEGESKSHAACNVECSTIAVGAGGGALNQRDKKIYAVPGKAGIIAKHQGGAVILSSETVGGRLFLPVESSPLSGSAGDHKTLGRLGWGFHCWDSFDFFSRMALFHHEQWK